jgi:hypothetical protein
MRTYHRQVIRSGLAAPQPSPHFIERIVEMAIAGLAGRGLGEEQLMGPVVHRLERMLNPAQRISRVFQADGMAGLLRRAAIRPVATKLGAS